MAKRAAVRKAVEQRLAMQARFLQSATHPSGSVRRLPTTATPTLRVAVGSTNGQTIDAHFGQVREFLIYDVSPHGAQWVERRPLNHRYCSGPTTCGDATTALTDAIQALQDCAVLLCARIGFEPWRPLENAGIQPNSEHAMESIAEALPAVYREWQKSGRLHATPARATAQGGFA
jgi:nitrogen fixation protein NifB